ncbi:glycosyltransferase family 4 protein [Acinetobacter sp. YH12200]|uniref:glycosyltransferase family 4 protein n=1 Tax=Acinetobacter sp. YH12200 TaxID=2601139 RepID=UPI0015D2CBC2|nr:glycosyltransferase family 4 protein [Acinetobacter sp. YH12200]
MKKNICFLVGNLNNPGGTERVSSAIANELTNLDFNIHMLSICEGQNPFFSLSNEIEVSSIFAKPKNMIFNSLFLMYKIRSFVIKNCIDTLVVVDSISCIFTTPALFGLNIKHICWEHFNFNEDLGIRYRKWGRILAAKYCDKIITLTHKDKSLWLKNIANSNLSEKIIVIPNPNPYENMQFVSKNKSNRVLAVGRLTHQKGFDLLIHAWALVCKHNSDRILTIVGNGPDENNLKELAISLEVDSRIEFLPATKNIEFYYRNSSFFCLSSRYEGFGMVILEAQALGLPVVSFDCDCGPSDLIKHDENGYLVDPGNYQSLAENLLKMINLPEETFIKFSKNSIESANKLNVNNLIPNWLSIL